MGSKQMNSPPLGGEHLCAGIALEKLERDPPAGRRDGEARGLGHGVEAVVELVPGEFEATLREASSGPIGIWLASRARCRMAGSSTSQRSRGAPGSER